MTPDQMAQLIDAHVSAEKTGDPRQAHLVPHAAHLRVPRRQDQPENVWIDSATIMAQLDTPVAAATT